MDISQKWQCFAPIYLYHFVGQGPGSPVKTKIAEIFATVAVIFYFVRSNLPMPNHSCTLQLPVLPEMIFKNTEVKILRSVEFKML